MQITFKIPDDNIEIEPGKDGQSTIRLKYDTDKVILLFKIRRNNNESDNAIAVNYDVQTNKIKVGTI